MKPTPRAVKAPRPRRMWLTLNGKNVPGWWIPGEPASVAALAERVAIAMRDRISRDCRFTCEDLALAALSSIHPSLKP